VTEARRFGRACLATSHYLASAAGLGVLADGGNALDAAVAANLALAVVTPYQCGPGGDLFALLWRDGLHAYNGSGRAPAAAEPEAVVAACGSERMPELGPHTVTVPGAVEGWFALLERFGTRELGHLAEPALAMARDGISLTARGAAAIQTGSDAAAEEPAWRAIYGDAAPGARLRQPELARTLELLGERGPEVFYRGEIGEAVAAHVRARSGLLAPKDLAEHTGDWVEPMRLGYRGVEVVELPPNTQGVAALEALAIVGAGPPPGDDVEGQRLMIDAMTAALADRDAHVTDPAWMSLAPEELLDPARVRARRAALEPPAGEPAPAGGDTTYVCAADEDGMCVGLIQSNYVGFGSGLTVPGFGINLHNRGAHFSLDPARANVIAPRKRTMHTLIPGMTLAGGRPELVFGTRGGHGQAPTHLQLVVRLIDWGCELQHALAAPRWLIEGGEVRMESRFPPAVVDGLRSRGYRIGLGDAYDQEMGHANAIRVLEDGYAAASDPRSEGAARGL
jgi:gamma-glutamyltranspeptidase / glutathione hydrolase